MALNIHDWIWEDYKHPDWPWAFIEDRNWHPVEVIGLSEDDHDELFRWCGENFGPSSPNTWRFHLVGDPALFSFNEKEDALAFKLRWA